MIFKTLEHTTPFEAQTFDAFSTLYAAVFGHPPDEEVHERLRGKTDLHLLLAQTPDGEAVGFKIGYRESPHTFYSWLGGVLPEARGQGIAQALMEQQHAWCRAQGYHTVRTKTLNRWRNMLILNLKCGFDIVGTQTGRDGVVRILLEKTL